MNKNKLIKRKKLRKIRFRKLSEKRWRKKLKKIRRKYSRTKVQNNSQKLFLKKVLDKKPIFKIFNEKKFYKKPIIYNNVAFIDIPEVFSFSKNTFDTINIIKEIAYSAKNEYSIFLNHENCKEIDLAASLVMDTIILEYRNACKKLKLKVNFSGRLSKCSKVNDILRFSGIVHNLNIEKTRENSRFKLLPLTKNEESGIMTTKIIDYYISCLKTKGYTLTEKGENYFSTMIGEVISNCSDHGGRNVQWYALGHFITEDGECNLTIFDFGDTIYEGLKNKSIYEKTINKLEQLTSFHRKAFHHIDEELLWTLFSLQHGISRLNSIQDETRGQGTVDLIDSFQKLGAKYDKEGKIQKPIMSITSGNINILFDGTYTIREEQNNLKIIAFNEENSLEQEPDNKYVKNIGNYFPGTVISIKFFIDRKYIEELKKSE